METLTTTSINDTFFLPKIYVDCTLSGKQTNSQTTALKEDSTCLMNLCNCKFLSDLLWPLTVLIILFVLKKQVQKVVDNIGESIRKGAKVKIGREGIEIGQELSEIEQKEKAEDEYISTIIEQEDNAQTEQTITKKEYIPNYLTVERSIFEVLLRTLYPRFKILSNIRIGRYEYDAIIDTLNNKDNDYIIEVKYYPIDNYSKNNLQAIALKLSFMAQNYESISGKKATPALIIVTNKDFNTVINSEVRNHLNEPFNNKNYIKLLMVKQADIDILTRRKIVKFLEE